MAACHVLLFGRGDNLEGITFMLRRCLTLGLPIGLGLLLLFAAPGVRPDLAIGVFAMVIIGMSIEIAHATTHKAGRYGASGMVACMAAMMAAMGTGLAIGYATGMVWDLGWANLVGVLAGFGHGLMMGRRYGPMAALDGAGGGVMGGLMGPMLGVMLLYLPVSLVLTALLMLLLQAIFSVGAVYLVAEATGRTSSSWLLRRVGWVLGAHLVAGPVADTIRSPGVDSDPNPAPVRRAKASRATAPKTTTPRSSVATMVSGVIGAVTILLIAVSMMSAAGSGGSSMARSDSSASTSSEPAIQATVASDGAQELTMELRYPRYTPRVMEAKAGVPLRLTLEAVGDPG